LHAERSGHVGAQLLLITRVSVSLSRAACNPAQSGADKLRDGLPLLRTPLCFSPSPSPDHRADSLSEDPDTSPSAQVLFAGCFEAFGPNMCNCVSYCPTLYSNLVLATASKFRSRGYAFH
jgi:hypothetical protein